MKWSGPRTKGLTISADRVEGYFGTGPKANIFGHPLSSQERHLGPISHRLCRVGEIFSGMKIVYLPPRPPVALLGTRIGGNVAKNLRKNPTAKKEKIKGEQSRKIDLIVPFFLRYRFLRDGYFVL